MRGLLNAMRLQAQSGQLAHTRIGTVSAYNPANYCAKVMIQPENVETGWLPVLSPWIGNGWGMFAPPTIGDLVEVQYQEGDFDAGMICLRFFNDADRPLSVPSGEFWLVHQSGSSLKFHNDGTVQLISIGTLTSSAPQWNHTGPVNITGTLHTTGDITTDTNVTATLNIADQAGAKTMAGMRTAYNSHTHTDPQGGTVGSPSAGM